MKKLTSTILLFFLFTCFVMGQNISTKSIVYLYDGSIYIGQIIKEDAFEVTLRTASIDTITISKVFVKKTVAGKNIIHKEKGKFHKIDGNYFTAELTVNAYADNHYAQTSIAFGKRMTAKLQVGIGVGLTNASAIVKGGSWEDHDFFQVFGVGKYYLNKNKSRLFTDLKAGWGFSLVDDWARNTQSGGLYLNPGIGFEFANRKKMKWSIKLSQSIQNVRARKDIGGFDDSILLTYNHWYNRTALSVGINF